MASTQDQAAEDTTRTEEGLEHNGKRALDRPATEENAVGLPEAMNINQVQHEKQALLEMSGNGPTASMEHHMGIPREDQLRSIGHGKMSPVLAALHKNAYEAPIYAPHSETDHLLGSENHQENPANMLKPAEIVADESYNMEQSSGPEETKLAETPPVTDSTSNSQTSSSSTHDYVPIHDQVPAKVQMIAEHEPTWSDCSTQTVVGPTTFRAGSTRPTSVPNFKSKPTSRGRREGPLYPNYPDQSFAALQSQYYPPPYQPHALRTRSSQSSHHSSYSSDSSNQPRELPTMQSGARTVGNTPAQSPGLFSPLAPRSRPATQDLDDSSHRTPALHPAHALHLQTPIE